MEIEKYRIKPTNNLRISQLSQWEDTAFSEEHVRDELVPKSVERLRELQLRLHAEEQKGILVVLQALDAAGKDEIITFIFSHLLPQGLKVTPTKAPSKKERKHDFLWRAHEGLPERGEIAIFNRSYYEDIISLLVYDGEGGVPVVGNGTSREPWEMRCDQINQFEKYLVESGFPLVKFFPYVSKEVQKERLLERMKNPEKQWEFSFSDVEDREKWNLFQDAYEKILNRTSTDWAPWYALPADNGWYTRYLACEIMIDVLEKIDPQFPVMKDEEKEKLEKYIEKLENDNV